MDANTIVAKELARTFYGSRVWSEMDTIKRERVVDRFMSEEIPQLVFDTILRLRQSIDVSDPEAKLT